MKRIIITGGSLNGNSGAEAMLVTAINRIEEQVKLSEFGIFTPYYKDDKILWKSNHKTTNKYLFDASPLKLALIIFPLSLLAGLLRFMRLNFAKALFPKSIQFLWNADVLIDVAGVSFIDNRLFFIPFNVLSIYPAFIMGVPVIKIAQATGPFNKTINRVFARHCFNNGRQLFARGSQTLEHLRQLKLDENKYSLSTDIAFCNKIGDSLTEENLELDKFLDSYQADNIHNKQVIGLCPSSVIENISLKEGLDYTGFLKNLSIQLIEKGYYLVIFPNATKEHKPLVRRNNDIPLIKELAKALQQNGLKNSFSYYSKNLNTDGVKTLINDIDFSIVSRFHAMIFALTLKKPVFVLGWSHKYLEVMEQFQLEKYVVDYNSTQIEKIVHMVDEISKNKESISHQIDQNIDRVKKKSFEQIAFTCKILNN